MKARILCVLALAALLAGCNHIPTAYLLTADHRLVVPTYEELKQAAVDCPTDPNANYNDCMAGLGYVWVSPAGVKQYEANLQQQAVITPERYAAARARCTAGNGDLPQCDQLTGEDVIQSEASASAQGKKYDPKEVSPERFAAARARCIAIAGESDLPLCDQLTGEDVVRSEATASEVSTHRS